MGKKGTVGGRRLGHGELLRSLQQLMGGSVTRQGWFRRSMASGGAIRFNRTARSAGAGFLRRRTLGARTSGSLGNLRIADKRRREVRRIGDGESLDDDQPQANRRR